VYFTGRCIAEIRLGSLIEDDHKEWIVRLFGRSEIRIYQMTVDGYDHSWKRLNPPPSKKKSPKPQNNPVFRRKY
jgi:hypothetical protein